MKVELLDGGMGTLLQAKGLQNGETPEDWNVEQSKTVGEIHLAYAKAEAKVLYANTFGANRLKYHGKYSLREVIRAGIANARKAATECGRGKEIRIALDVGPTGRMLAPAGDLPFEEAVSAFAEQVRLGAEAGADLIVVETMGDVREVKAAVLAARENCSLPVYATVSVGVDGKLLTGGSVECVAALLESLHVEAYGFNCGLGPDQMLPNVRRLAKVSTRPIIVKPNAGLPLMEDGRTRFSFGPQEFSASMKELVKAGAEIVGGCCGTTPAHLEAVNATIGEVITTRPKTAATVVSSGIEAITLHPHEGLIIGERINPTGKKVLKEAYARGDMAYVLREAVKQVDAGARILDVNCGVPGLDESALLTSTIEAVQSVITSPIQIDTADPEALEGALRHVNGKALVNSVNGKRSLMDTVFPLVKKYGGTIVALCLDEDGIPATSDGRLAIARKILEEGEKYGFTKKDFVFDALTLAVSSDQQAARVTLETVRRLTEELGVNTVLGVSNVSFGLPNRPALNNAMYALAKRAGLSAAIANPAAIRDELTPEAEDVLLGRDSSCAHWIAVNGDEVKSAAVNGLTAASEVNGDLSACIRRGLKEDARQFAELALEGGKDPLKVVQEQIVPALEEIGRGFEKGTVYLPQLLMAADAAGEAFAVIKRELMAKGQKRTDRTMRPIVLATVKGDIHDIGKNIVRALLENYGFDVIDLGRDVSPEKIVEAARKNNAALVGLSALMTTTVKAMEETIRQIKNAGLDCRTVVGGAVVTQEYADEIGADFYAKDAMRTVRIAESLSVMV